MSFKTNKTTQRPFPMVKGLSPEIPFSKEGIATVPDATGVYIMYNKAKTPIYVGRSKDGEYSGLRHRLQSYYEVDDFEEHPTKEELRPHIRTVRYKKTTEEGARKLEAKLKQFTEFNADNKMNEEKKKHD